MNQPKKYIIALTNLYGQVPSSKVAEIYNSQNDTQLSPQDIAAYLEEDLSQHHVYSYKDHFVHETIMEFNLFRKIRKQQKGKPYYVPDQEELLKYTDMDYYEKPDSYHQLQQHLTQHYFQKEPEKAEMLTERLRDECLEGLDVPRFHDLMVLFGIEDKDQLDEIIQLAAELAYNVRKWECNGHTPQELRDMGIPCRAFPKPSLLTTFRIAKHLIKTKAVE